MIPSLATGQFLKQIQGFLLLRKLVQCKQYPVYVTERAHISWLIQLGPAIAPLPEIKNTLPTNEKSPLCGACKATHLTLECLFS